MNRSPSTVEGKSLELGLAADAVPSLVPVSLADAWEEHSGEWISWARAPAHDGFWEGTWPALRAVLPDPDGLTVEVGCGEGRVSRCLTGIGHTVVAFERSTTLARAAALGESAVTLALADAASLPVADGSASLVVACMVLQDVDELSGSVREIARVLRPGGRLCLAIPHPFSSARDPRRLGEDGPFLVDQPYLSERRYVDRVDRDGLGMTFVSVHRPLSGYVAELTAASLVIETITESGPGLVPWLLVCRAKKEPPS